MVALDEKDAQVLAALPVEESDPFERDFLPPGGLCRTHWQRW